MNIPHGSLALSILALFVFATALSAQDLDYVTIGGRVVDPNGLPVAGALIIAAQLETGIERSVVTDGSGRFMLVKLKPGTYKVNASENGFGRQEKEILQAISGQVVLLEFTLSPAAVTAEQTVNATDEEASAVDTTRTVVGETLTEREIEETPNNTRNALDLVLTLSGTTEEQLSTNGLAEDRFQSPATAPLEQGNFSISGGTGYSNNLTIDGLDNNDDRASRDRFQPPLEAIAEVQVIKNQFSAEYGRASGGRINLRTRGGGNHLRGRAFIFFRDDDLNANSWYNNSRGLARPPLTEYDPGFALGGPVTFPFYNGRNKTFFSIAYEYTDLQDTTFIDTWVPIGNNPRFALPAASSTTCPSNVPACIDTSSSPATPILPFQSAVNTPNVSHMLTSRIDHNFTSSNSFVFGSQFGRKHNQRTTIASTTRLDDALQVRNASTEAYNLTDNQVFGSKAVNQIRGQYSVYEPSFQTNDPFGPVVLISYTNPAPGGGGQTLIAGNSTSAVTGDATGFPQNRRETRIQVQDSLSYLTGRHSLKFGFDVMNVRSKALGLGDATGTFNFNGVLNFQNNVLSRFRQNFGTASDVKNTYTGVFFNDEMRLRYNLTMSYGVRYERETAVSDNNNWGPRFGLAWDPFSKGKGVVRFGAGIFYNRVLLRTVADSIQNIGGNLVSFDTNTIGTSAGDPRRTTILAAIATTFPNAFPSVDAIKSMLSVICPTASASPAPCTMSTGFINNVTSTGNPLRTVEPDLVVPESYQFNIGFEREIFKGIVLEANYTVNKTVHLWRDTNGNAPVLPADYPDWTAWLLTHPFSLTNQNGTVRTYQFYHGLDGTSSGLSSAPNGNTGCPTSGVGSIFTTNSTCYVNLNTASTSKTSPATASVGNNNNATGGPIGIALAAIAQFRPNASLQEMSVIASRGNAFYHGLTLGFRSRHRKLGNGFGASFRLNYTLSKTMDDGLNNTSNAEINGDFSREWARTLQDRRHRIVFTGSFDTPWWLGKLKYSPLIRWGSSAPFNLGNGGSDRNLDDVSNDRLNFTGNLRDLHWRKPGSPIPTALISQLSLQPIGSKGGNLSRNAGNGPSFYTFDLNITREWKISERIKLRPVIEFDNILNAAVFSYGAAFIDFNGLTQTANSAAQQNFLVPNRTYRQRQIRIGLRFDF